MTTWYSAPARILIADSDHALLNLLCFAFRIAGFEPIGASTGAEALAAIDRDRFTLLVLDFDLPEGGAVNVCASVRKHSTVPILLLSERDREEHLLQGLAAGADEYLTKPFSPRILVALARALIRRASCHAPDNPLPDNGIANRFRVDVDELLLIHADGAVALTQIEVRILGLLMLNAGKTLCYNNLIAEAWNNCSTADRNTVKHAVFRLRKKLSVIPAAATALKTGAGGYAWIEE